jgi:hypothetical protein
VIQAFHLLVYVLIAVKTARRVTGTSKTVVQTVVRNKLMTNMKSKHTDSESNIDVKQDTESESECGIHQFWVAGYTMYGCNDCHKAGWSADTIDHTEDCEVDKESGQSGDNNS